MTTLNLLQHRSASPLAARGARTSELSLPGEVLAQTGRRVFAVGVAFAVLWSVPLVLFLLMAPYVPSLPMLAEGLWPMPGAAFAGTGLVVSLLLVILSPRLSARPRVHLFLSSAFLVVIALLFGLLEYWVPEFNHLPATFIGVVILAYSSIVPNTPGRTLAVGLLAATMAPLGLMVARLRGVQVEANWFQYLVAFLPNYLCAFLAVIPAGIIRQLGKQVKKARELGSYRLEEILGKGGMGEVYKASHQLLARPAAVKLIRPEVLGAIDAERSRIILERFRREADAAASLRSPHSISLYDFGVAEDGTFFFVMELLDGLDLERLVERFGPVDPARAVHLLAQACESLEEAHQRGLIHRDVKPSNIFTCRMGLAVDFVKVLDYGLVKHEGESVRADARLTAPDQTAGTPAYMAPESVLGTMPLDHRADIYALGCVAYWLVTGQLVFQDPNPLRLMFRHAHDAPVPPSRRSELPISPALDQLILACLAKHPDQRPQSALDLARRLRAAVPAEESWTEERAERWWRRHHPASTHSIPTACDLYLSKTHAEVWATPDVAAQAPTAAYARIP